MRPDPRPTSTGGGSSATAALVRGDEPLRIAYLTYRGKPHVGGQGVYTRHLTKALVDLGHHVEVLGGQPFPILDDRVPLHELPSLDIYNDYFPMRMPGVWELKTLGDWVEVAPFMAGTFPEPLGLQRARRPAPAHPRQRLRPGARQPVPRLRPAGHRAAWACRCSPPSTTRSPSTAASRWSTARRRGSASPGALVHLHQDADPRRVAHEPRHHGVAELVQGHPHRPPGAARPHARRARRRRPGAVPAARRRRSGCPAG